MKVKSEIEVAQSCPTLSDPMDCSLPGSSIHGILQATVLEWGAMSAIVWWFEHSLALPFFGIGMKTDFFPVLWPLPSIPNLLTYWVQHFHSIIFQDLKYVNWNSITSTSFVHSNTSWGHLTSYSRMSASRWVITQSWLSGSWSSFFVQFCVFLPPLLSIFCFFWVHTTCVLYWAHLCMKCSLSISNFLKRSLVFPILLLSSISLHWSLIKAFLSFLAILWNFTFRWVYLFFFFLSFVFHLSSFLSYL